MQLLKLRSKALVATLAVYMIQSAIKIKLKIYLNTKTICGVKSIFCVRFNHKKMAHKIFHSGVLMRTDAFVAQFPKQLTHIHITHTYTRSFSLTHSQ